MKKSYCCGQVNSCGFNQTIDSEDFAVGSAFDSTVEQFEIVKNRNVKFVPRLIGQKFPNLKEFYIRFCELTVVRHYYFKNMRNLARLYLDNNKITAIEPASLKDLVKVIRLDLSNNMIETLDENLFAAMINLEGLSLSSNKIKFLSPTMLQIPRGKIGFVDLKSNVCINGTYNSKQT